jgi:pimeloyl-ACP methyl ester carboxylesterase
MSAVGRARPGFSWPLALAFVGVGALAGVVAHVARSDFDQRGFVLSPDGLRLAYEVHGEGPPLVALAGGPGISHHAFHPHLARLRRAARIIYFDPRGRGDSDPGSYSGFARVRCRRGPEEFLVAFSCKRRGVCPSCGAKRAAELAAFLRDAVPADRRQRPAGSWVHAAEGRPRAI